MVGIVPEHPPREAIYDSDDDVDWTEESMQVADSPDLASSLENMEIHEEQARAQSYSEIAVDDTRMLGAALQQYSNNNNSGVLVPEPQWGIAEFNVTDDAERFELVGVHYGGQGKGAIAKVGCRIQGSEGFLEGEFEVLFDSGCSRNLMSARVHRELANRFPEEPSLKAKFLEEPFRVQGVDGSISPVRAGVTITLRIEARDYRFAFGLMDIPLDFIVSFTDMMGKGLYSVLEDLWSQKEWNQADLCPEEEAELQWATYAKELSPVRELALLAEAGQKPTEKKKNHQDYMSEALMKADVHRTFIKILEPVAEVFDEDFPVEGAAVPPMRL